MNRSRVIPARILMQKPTGGACEVFCLQSRDSAPSGAPRWECLIGGKRIGVGAILRVSKGGLSLEAHVLEKNGPQGLVEFSWSPRQESFEQVLEKIGEIPLPPYLGRRAEPEDHQRYQTVYAREAGSVAAPTAGLHFTPEVLQRLKDSGVELSELVLHVGAGTFRPLQSDELEQHEMHAERAQVSIEFLKKWVRHLERAEAPVIAVGTTSLRALESLALLAGRARRGEIEDFSAELEVGQFEWKGLLSEVAGQAPLREGLSALIQGLEAAGLSSVRLVTRLMVAPGFKIQSADALITNFHQPESTLLVLVATFLGDPLQRWREIYDEALRENYRFLSYGDSSLLIRSGSRFPGQF